MEKKSKKLPRKSYPLFWDVDAKELDPEKNVQDVMERILEFGTWESVLWLRKFYGDEKIKQYILMRGYKVLSPKTLSFWKNILPINRKQWHTLSLQRASVMPWR